MAATIIDVAKKCGYSKATVSRAFASPETVSERAKKRIYAAASELNYTPNPIARAMARQKTDNISFVVHENQYPAILNPFYSLVLEAIMQEAMKRDYSLFVTSNDHMRLPTGDAYIKKHMDGVIIAGQTDEAYVRMFEKWILKPWEYRSEMSAELQSKWNPDKNGAASNQLSYKIYNPGISSQGDVTVGGNAGGTLRYFTGNVSITNMSADITFVYNAFGERAELRGTGQYVMKGAKMSGWGSGVVGNLVIESQMYPGEIDFNSLNTNNQKFSGNYLVKQGWSDVYAEVSSE